MPPQTIIRPLDPPFTGLNKIKFQYLAPDNSVIKVKDSLPDLGIQISSNLTFTVHIENLVTSAA